jgi:hypothetical protein
MYQIGIVWSYFNHIWMFSSDFHEISIIKFHENPSSRDELMHAVSLSLSRQMQGRYVDQVTID